MVFDAEFDAYQRGSDRASRPWRVTAALGIAAGLAVVALVWWAMATVADWNLPTPVVASAGVLPDTVSVEGAAARTEHLVIQKASEGPLAQTAPQEPSVLNWDSEFDRTAGMLVLPKDLAPDGATTAFRAPTKPLAASPEPVAALLPVPPQPPAPDATVSTPEGALTPDKPASAMHEAIAGHRKALAQEHEALLAAAAKPHKTAGSGYYTEKLIEQGDAGGIKFRYLRRKCAPPNMVDVCFMPAENRRSIVVQR
jgi:hypothetical protein